MLERLCLVLLWLPTLSLAQGDYFKTRRMIHPGAPGPWVQSSKGEVWPMPKLIKYNKERFLVLDPASFEFRLDEFSSRCDILTEAVSRYYKRTFPRRKGAASVATGEHPWLGIFRAKDAGFVGLVNHLDVIMKNKRGCQDEMPKMDMDEHYELKVDAPDGPGQIQLIAFSVWGILRGLETFSQLVTINHQHGGLYELRSLQLMDHPRFSWRGIMLDSSRHFLSKRVIKDNLDLMEMNKMNVFHWHLTDDNAFPYESFTYPNLTLKGAYRPYTHTYSQEDVREIIEYARLRGIRVVPEFDTPGHTESWGLGQPGILTPCYRGTSPNGQFGPMNPISEFVYAFLKKFFKEVTSVFPDKYVHLGGDEVDLECWQTNPTLKKYVEKNLQGNFRKLESAFFQRLLSIIESLQENNSYIVWQEVFDNQDRIKKDTVVEVWKGENAEWGRTMAKITHSGYRALLSAPWYLNYISYGSDWTKYYKVEPLSFGPTTEEQKRLVMGGEACLWGEFVNSVNLLPRLWPRASAVAERLWSAAHVKDVHAAAPRLQEHECRMLQRGYPVEPANGPGFCDVMWNSE